MLTKYTDAELRAELTKEIAALLLRRDAVHPTWLTHKICTGHKPGLPDYDHDAKTIEPQDVAFWRFCGYAHTRKLATICINELETADDEGGGAPTPFRPGFLHLQKQYVIPRDGADVMVPTEQMTPDELRTKATNHDRKAGSLIEHARELRRYADIRDEELKKEAKKKAAAV
jgi:hypothetical protein